MSSDKTYDEWLAEMPKLQDKPSEPTQENTQISTDDFDIDVQYFEDKQETELAW